MKKHLSTILLSFIFLAGLALLLYPTVSDYWNSLHQSRAIADYTQRIKEFDDSQYTELIDQARDYNRMLLRETPKMKDKYVDYDLYDTILDITGTGIMSYVEIPKINCMLPIYHGTDEAVLQIAIGHLPGTSMPVGGEGTHCVVSGHRGLPSAKLFSDLDQLIAGDIVILRTLNQTLVYEIDQILIVLPFEVDSLDIQVGQDLLTLVTCTPYGINSHRLLVRGHRVDDIQEIQIRINADGEQIEPLLIAPILAVPMLVLLVIYVNISSAISTRRKKHNQK